MDTLKRSPKFILSGDSILIYNKETEEWEETDIAEDGFIDEEGNIYGPDDSLF